MNSNGLTRSMSKKDCSPDNSACEGVFGRLKNEMFFNTDWTGVSISEFMEILDNYLHLCLLLFLQTKKMVRFYSNHLLILCVATYCNSVHSQ